MIFARLSTCGGTDERTHTLSQSRVSRKAEDERQKQSLQFDSRYAVSRRTRLLLLRERETVEEETKSPMTTTLRHQRLYLRHDTTRRQSARDGSDDDDTGVASFGFKKR